MSANTNKQDWSTVKGKIKSKWGKFSDADIESFKDNMPLISDKIQKIYGITKDKADVEYAEFAKKLDIDPAVAEEKNKTT